MISGAAFPEGLDPGAELLAAVRRQAGAGVVLLAVSGRLAAGKDTVAERAMLRCAPGATTIIRFGAGVVTEVRRIAAVLAGHQAAGLDRHAALAACAAELGHETGHLQQLTDVLWSPLARQGTEVVGGRTATARQACQIWGTTRREADPLIWVRQGLTEALRTAAAGTSVVIPDVRTPVEADAVRAVGFLLVRVTAGAEERRRRLATRDGLVLRAQELEHSTETALDDYPSFDLVVDSEAGTIDETVDLVVASLSRA